MPVLDDLVGIFEDSVAGEATHERRCFLDRMVNGNIVQFRLVLLRVLPVIYFEKLIAIECLDRFLLRKLFEQEDS